MYAFESAPVLLNAFECWRTATSLEHMLAFELRIQAESKILACHAKWSESNRYNEEVFRTICSTEVPRAELTPDQVVVVGRALKKSLELGNHLSEESAREITKELRAVGL